MSGKRRPSAHMAAMSRLEPPHAKRTCAGSPLQPSAALCSPLQPSAALCSPLQAGRVMPGGVWCLVACDAWWRVVPGGVWCLVACGGRNV